MIGTPSGTRTPQQSLTKNMNPTNSETLRRDTIAHDIEDVSVVPEPEWGSTDISSTTHQPAHLEQAILVVDKSKRCWCLCDIKSAIGILLLSIIVFVIVDSLTHHQYVKNGITDLLEWMTRTNPSSAFFAFVGVSFTTTILFIPGIILTLGSGFVFSNTFGLGFGMALGTLAYFVGAASAAIVSFWIGRFLLRDWVTRLTSRSAVWKGLDHAMEHNGLRIMVLLRLSPILYLSPYINYGAGGLAISTRDYIISLFAALPGTVMYVFLGGSAKSLSESANGGTTAVLWVGIALSVVAVALTSRYAKVELDKLSATTEENTEVADGDVEIATSSDDGNHHPAITTMPEA
jgi:uncharacterized membrane protein YdjX (TVP38/TMEM64 family)